MTAPHRPVVTVALVLALVCLLAPAAVAQPAKPARGYVVRLADGHAAPGFLRGHPQVKANHKFSRVIDGFSADLTDGQAAVLSRHPHVAAVTPDATVEIASTRIANTWGVDRIDQRALPLDRTFTHSSTGAGVTVFVVDSGVRGDHPEFGGRVTKGWTHPDIEGAADTDCNGHGTHVAGTIGSTNLGIAPAVTIVPVRVFDCTGVGTVSSVISALDWISANKPAGTAVVNMSLDVGKGDPVLDAAVEASIASGLVHVLAAGNRTADSCQTSPARVPTAITVAASTVSDTAADFSNYGTCVDLYAPGQDIWSVPFDNLAIGFASPLSGTSMAAPHVAGVAALYLQGKPTATPDAVSTWLRSNATTSRLSGLPANSPNRLLYTETASTTPPVTEPPAIAPAPIRPSRPTAVANRARTDGRLRVLWVPGAVRADGLDQPTKFVIRVVNKAGTTVRVVRAPATATARTIKGLNPGKPYRAKVRARNAAGGSRWRAAPSFVRLPS